MCTVLTPRASSKVPGSDFKFMNWKGRDTKQIWQRTVDDAKEKITSQPDIPTTSSNLSSDSALLIAGPSKLSKSIRSASPFTTARYVYCSCKALICWAKVTSSSLYSATLRGVRHRVHRWEKPFDLLLLLPTLLAWFFLLLTRFVLSRHLFVLTLLKLLLAVDSDNFKLL